MKTLRITAELVVTPKMFAEWCERDVPISEKWFEVYVEKLLWTKFGVTKDFGNYEDFINQTVDVKGLRITTKELK